MKKLTVFFSVILITAISCSKKGDYTCSCSVTAPGFPTNTVSVPFMDVKKDFAQQQCDDLQATYISGGASATCTLN
ncbi:hypothetical protein F0919_13305 [Taibaiella lutea]|uniref:Lipoprotein n=1 Tax=Taibaiella lutea TaxID=2608001 RepID=A0A5M6CHT8_9BACT|nr:hypothetical protein [Taibaiella lutea]KAA5533512.1 hypothetical protein F0919_13305 [Taibaiella lutea]